MRANLTSGSMRGDWRGGNRRTSRLLSSPPPDQNLISKGAHDAGRISAAVEDRNGLAIVRELADELSPELRPEGRGVAMSFRVISGLIW
jgi:hypothetical protein